VIRKVIPIIDYRRGFGHTDPVKVKAISRMPVAMDICVECYTGYQAEEPPRRFIFDDRTVEVAGVIDQWLAPDHRYVKL
jgi:hypothetical protein